MDLCETIERYANAVSSFDHWDGVGCCNGKANAIEAAKEVRALRDCLNLQLDMANAAVAYMEHQANPPEGGLTDTHAYFHKLAELGKAFMAAREKAKGMNNGST